MRWLMVLCVLALLAGACADPAGAPDAAVATPTLCATAPEIPIRAGEPPPPPRLVPCPTPFFPTATPTLCSIGGVPPDIVTREGDPTRPPGEPTPTAIPTIEFPCPNTPPPRPPVPIGTP